MYVLRSLWDIIHLVPRYSSKALLDEAPLNVLAFPH